MRLTKATDAVRHLFAGGSKRSHKPVRPACVAPGVIITDHDAWAWLEVPATNSDLMTDAERDSEEKSVQTALTALAGFDIHLKVLWDEHDNDGYVASVVGEPGRSSEWAELRADTMADLGLPQRIVLLGVRLSTKMRGKSSSRRKAKRAHTTISSEQINDAIEESVRVAQRMPMAPADGKKWGVRLASTERLIWMLSRESDLSATCIDQQVVTGTELAQLGRYRVDSLPTCVRVTSQSGERFSAVLALSEFPEISGEGQEWAAMLSDLSVTVDDGVMHAGVELSSRFEVLSTKDAIDLTARVRKNALEQINAASRSEVAQVPQEVQDTLDDTNEIGAMLKRGKTSLMHDHTRVIVHALDQETLESKVSNAIQAFGEMGITATLLIDEQMEAWQECQPGEFVRIEDLPQIRETANFVSSWFWQGSAVGETSSDASVVGFTTGTTCGPVRIDLRKAIDNSHPPVVCLTGVTRYGKTTTALQLMMDALMHPQSRQPWGVITDLKGDINGHGLAALCQEFGLPFSHVELTEHDNGSLDPFVTVDGSGVVDEATAQLMGLLPTADARACEGVIGYACANVADTSGSAARSWMVVDELDKLATSAAGTDKATVLRLAVDGLRTAQRHGLGRLIVGKPQDGVANKLQATHGLTLITVPGASLPSAKESADRWDAPQRSSSAALRGIFAWVSSTVQLPAMRASHKIAFFPECHLLTGTQAGRTALERASRMWASYGVSLMLDTQDAASLTDAGFREGIGLTFVFGQQARESQRAACEILGLEESDEMCDVVGGLGDSDEWQAREGHAIRRGHALVRDRTGRVASVQIVVPPKILKLLDTSSRASAERIAAQSAPDEIKLVGV